MAMQAISYFPSDHQLQKQHMPPGARYRNS
jgi:hypothetical protein